jgi:BASS family bile acid:Na+ symporter
MNEIDLVRLNFNPQSLWALNFIIGLVMFGVALDLKVADFKAVLVMPKPVLIGLAGQFLLLPAFTFLLVLAIQPAPSVALGMMLVAACPGGNISNFLTHYARGNTALSITMTRGVDAVAIVMTPLNLSLLGRPEPGDGENPARSSRSTRWTCCWRCSCCSACRWPWACGSATASRLRGDGAQAGEDLLAGRLRPVRGRRAGGELALLHRLRRLRRVRRVPAQRAGAAHRLLRAPGSAGLPERDRRAVSIEVGIQNSALGLILIFNFFDGLGGMAIVTAWWGIWHIVSGLTRGDLLEPRRAADPGCRADRRVSSPAPGLPRQPGGGGAGARGTAVAVSRVGAMCARCRPRRLPGVDYVQADIRSPGSMPSVRRQGGHRRAPGLHRHAGQGQQPRIRVRSTCDGTRNVLDRLHCRTA